MRLVKRKLTYSSSDDSEQGKSATLKYDSESDKLFSYNKKQDKGRGTISSDETLDGYINEKVYLVNKILAGRQTTKRQKTAHLSPVTFGLLNIRLGKPKYKDIKILLDTGASKSIIRADRVKKLRKKHKSKTIWDTAAGQMSTNKTVKAKFRLSEFDERKEITWDFAKGCTLDPKTCSRCEL